MNILIAGGTGLIGSSLVPYLSAEHKITVVSRKHAHVKEAFEQPVKSCTWDTLSAVDANQFDAVINLAGYNIAAKRWSNKTKQLIIDSRVNTNSMLINWIIQSKAKPHFYCANAVGIYGAQSTDDPTVYDEDSPINFDKPKDFLNKVGALWQQSLQPAIDYGMPVTTTRFGVVLKHGEGFLGKMAPVYKLGLGSIIGSGKQVLSWVDIDDVLLGYTFLLKNPNLTGAFNFTSPNPITQAEFSNTFAKVLKRTIVLKTPAFIIRLLFGEMGEYLINSGQAVKPKRLLEAGFTFKYPDIEKSLQREYGDEGPDAKGTTWS
jgi:uncharacterized protein